MATKSALLLEQYIAALHACLASAEGFDSRNNIFVRLAAAGAIQTELENGNFGAAFGILTTEQHALGWDGIYGQGGDLAHESFQRFAEELKNARLEGLPDAGFGH